MVMRLLSKSLDGGSITILKFTKKQKSNTLFY